MSTHLIITDPITVTVDVRPSGAQWLRINGPTDHVDIVVDDPGDLIEALRDAADALEASLIPLMVGQAEEIVAGLAGSVEPSGVEVDCG